MNPPERVIWKLGGPSRASLILGVSIYKLHRCKRIGRVEDAQLAAKMANTGFASYYELTGQALE
jgi:hypothetical protein